MRPDPVESFFARYALIVALCLGGTVAIAWWWLVRMAMPAGGMTMAPVSAWSPSYLGTAFAMWLLMMVAMMLPAASLMILFYARFAGRSGMAGGGMATASFVLTYLVIWALFSLAAVLIQAALVSSGAVSAMALAVGDRRLAGALLLIAGLYQLSPLKRSCLAACRSPLDFLIRLWRPGVAGAVRLGAVHGLYCVGCCWALMLLLFVGGVMNLAWVALLALLVTAERLAPQGRKLGLALGIPLAAAGLWLILGPV